jgi:hypothetical protein
MKSQWPDEDPQTRESGGKWWWREMVSGNFLQAMSAFRRIILAEKRYLTPLPPPLSFDEIIVGSVRKEGIGSHAYLTDVSPSLNSHFECLKPGGYEVIVVGNSLHGSADWRISDSAN